MSAAIWTLLLIIHSLLAVLLLGAITHQAIAVWVPARVVPGNFVGRARAVPAKSYVNAIVVFYIVTAIFGAWIYTRYRIGARFTLEQGRFWMTYGAFELKEHFIAVGLGVLPAYWYFWTRERGPEYARTRAMLTTVLAFCVWWGFLVGHLTNNIRGLG
jgi:hypothetical protein